MNVEIYAGAYQARQNCSNRDNFLVLDVKTAEKSISPQTANGLPFVPRRFEVDMSGVILGVSDGIGAFNDASDPSRIAVQAVCQKILETTHAEEDLPIQSKTSMDNKLLQAVTFANNLIYCQGRNNPELRRMGATFTGIGIKSDKYNLLQIGNSRGYIIRKGDIYRLTRDQSLVQELIDLQQISPEEARSHDLKNVLLQALGTKHEIQPVLTQLSPKTDDILLLCTNGLTDTLDEQDLFQIIEKKHEDLNLACQNLIQEAITRCGNDNIAVILAKTEFCH